METKYEGVPMAEKPAMQSRYRSLNRNGRFNVQAVGLHGVWLTDLYHSLLTLPWTSFMGLVLMGYFALNLFFAEAYLLCGPNALQGMALASGSRFEHAFFFSVQTIATIGYGGITPNSLSANILVTVESLIGMLSLALVTGLFYARFARPSSRIAFSHWAVIQTHDKVPSLMFRMVNRRRNQLVEAHVDVILLRDEKTEEGETFRNFHDLKLERAHSAVLPVSWTVVHPIDQDSPLYGLTNEDMIRQSAEIIVSLSGVDETFSQSVFSRYSYVPDEILWNYRFKDMLQRSPGGSLRVYVERIHDVEPQLRLGEDAP
jgi:inward rectifier potassium channel